MRSIAELLDLAGKAAIVTGGAKGIGSGICYRLAEAGASVVVADIDFPAAEATAQELRQRGWIAVAHKADVASEAEIRDMISFCQGQYGSLDILVNNAGIYPAAPLADLSDELFDRVMRVNLRSVFLATKYAGEVMKQQGSGTIINITSIDALHPSMVGLAHYDASKHGAWGFTKNAALELAPYNVTVNAIAPGGVRTPGTGTLGLPDVAGALETFAARIPMGRMGEPDDIGTVALFLASGLARYITGAQLVVDGGVLLR